MILPPASDRLIFDAIRLPQMIAQQRERLRNGAPPHLPPLVVCDGWTEPRHARIVLKDGDPNRVSHGMCAACEEAARG